MHSKPFRVRLKDSTPESLEKRVKEKLNAGYSLHTPPTPVPTSHKLLCGSGEGLKHYA
jgi:hypothetical protein